VELAEALAAEGLAGLKDSSGEGERHLDYLRVAAARRHAGGDFSILAGSEPLVLLALRGGAAGCVLGLANLRPDLLVELRAAFVGGREDEAERLQAEVSRLNAELDRGPSFTGLTRAVAERLNAHGIDYPAHQRRPLGAALATAGRAGRH
jgi:4-hydroxy-tetrahydrodipicolinate synthase